MLGYSQGGRERSCVPGLSTRGISCGGKSFVLFWGIVSLLDELFPLWCVIPWGSHVGKGKKSKVLHPVFYLCRVAQVWMRFVLVCLGFWHCEHPVFVFLVMLCSAKAGWHHQDWEGSRRDRLYGGAGGLCSCRSIRSGLELGFLLMEMEEVEQEENSALIFGPSFVHQVDNTASQSGSCSTKTHQILIELCRGPGWEMFMRFSDLGITSLLKLKHTQVPTTSS